MRGVGEGYHSGKRAERGMTVGSGVCAAELRRELAWRNRKWGRGRLHVESYGGQPVVVYSPQTEADGSVRHGNFFDAAYAAIMAWPPWMKRFNKVHTQGRTALPK